MRVPLGLVPALLLALGGFAFAEDGLVPNPEFKQGGDAPEGWKLSGGKGRWVDREAIEVTGEGKGSNQWQCGVRFTPGGLYRFQMLARQVEGSGCTVSGPEFANRDYHGLPGSFQWQGHVFRVPDGVTSGLIRLGQWEAKGTVQFDAVRLVPAIPIYKPVGKLLLGEGESIRDGKYLFQGTFSHAGSNFHRTLAGATAAFNSDRWCLGGDVQVTYRFALPGYPFTSGEAGFNLNHLTAGGCQAEVSRDGRTWLPLVHRSALGTAKAPLPASLLPADAIWLRIRPSTPGSNFQVNEVRFEAALAGKPPTGTGRTLFADAPSPGAQKAVESITLDDDPQSGRTALRVKVKNPTDKKVTAVLGGTIAPPRASSEVIDPQEASLFPGYSKTFEINFPARQPGEHAVQLDVNVQGVGMLQTTLRFTVPDYYRSDYGENLAGVSGPASVWWCDATHKVPRTRPLPTAEGPAARLAAARNDWEAVQVVVRPKEPLKGLTVAAGPLTGPGSAVIPAENVRVLRVYYHYVENPTDGTGVRDWWPDALPPLRKPLDVAAGTNQPLWVLVYVPKDARPGDYTGALALEAEGWSASVPLRLHVWNFALPERNHLETAFGLSLGEAFRYHGVKTEADRRKLADLYFRSFAEHRISPYDPTPLDRFEVKFDTAAKEPKVEIDFSRFDRAMAEAVQQYHFTGFSLPIQGMGGGTFHERYDPQIGPFKESTPQYQALFASQVKQIESHLRGKGWLDMAYVYWFDEPDPKDYAFVRGGMERLKKYAPGIRRMLTEEPGEELAGAVDIWCPVTPNYSHEAAEKRRKQGERFWWYVCCGPKAPFCTLFIDHAATELRVWHWQTWQRKIDGTLVWSSNYWTSDAAYPDKPQNPYEDPMGYVSGYSTPKGTKSYWGNGDGRFIYPAEAAAVPGLSPAPVLEPPVSSIRWEMLREGVEDYEFLWLLRDLLAARRSSLAADEAKRIASLLEVPAEITRDMTTFTTDPAPVYARRAEIAEAIERLAPQ